MNLQDIFIGALLGFFTGVVFDLREFQRARKASPGQNLAFDWLEALPRWAWGAVTGAVAASGVQGLQSFVGVAA